MMQALGGEAHIDQVQDMSAAFILELPKPDCSFLC